MDLVTDFGSYRNIEVRAGHYSYDMSLAVFIWDMYEGCIAKITACLDDQTLKEDEAYVDTNNCPWAKEFLIKNNIARALNKYKISGYCTYQAFKFNISKLTFEEE